MSELRQHLDRIGEVKDAIRSVASIYPTAFDLYDEPLDRLAHRVDRIYTDEIERLGRCNEQIAKTHAQALNAHAYEYRKLKEENQRLCEGPQLRVNVEALVDDVEGLSSELDALRQFVEKHSRTSGHKMDGTAQYRLTGAIGRGRTLWDAISRAENMTEMGDET